MSLEPKNEQSNNLLSVKEAAKFLGISQVTLRRIIKGQKIGFFRVGYRILFSKEQHLFPYLDKCEIQPKAEVI